MQDLSFKAHSKRYLAVLFLVLVLAVTTISGLVITGPSDARAATPKLSLQFTCAQAVDYKQGYVCVHTQAKAALTIKVKYCSGSYETSKSLQGTQFADTKGNQRWSWVPQTKWRGTATAYVHEQFHGQSLNASTHFITQAPTRPPAPTATSYYPTLPPGSVLPNDATCAERVIRNPWEPRPDNTAKNHVNEYTSGHTNTGSATYLQGEAPEIAARITGNFTGTTDEIFQWAACKWGFDINTIRAQAVAESDWHQSQLGDSASQTQPGLNGHPSVGILQVKGGDIPPTHPGTWPYAWDSTSWNVDYTLAVRRACFEGKETWLGNGYAAGDLWGCIGRWYSGAWHDSGAQNYIASVKNHMANQDWNHYGAGLAPTFS